MDNEFPEEKTPTSKRTLPVELSIAVLDRLDAIETLARTAVGNSAQVLEISKDLRILFEELRDRYNALENRVIALEEAEEALTM